MTVAPPFAVIVTVIVTFDVGQFKDYSIDLERSKREPPTWTGFGEKEGGEKMHFKFVFLKD